MPLVISTVAAGYSAYWAFQGLMGPTLVGPDGAVLRTVIEHARRRGLARILVLESGDWIAAVSANFVYGRRMEVCFTAYIAAFERTSQGTNLIMDYAQ